MLCAFMCSYKPLPISGTGCGIATDHLARSGVIGNGARLRCGTPASLATVDTATVGGVVDEPMMTSALDSVTKRRALVVAAVGSPPSSSTITFNGTPPISFGTNSSALRSGMPSAAAGPVVLIVMPMVISLVSALANEAGSAKVNPSVAADRKAFFIYSSLRRFFLQIKIHSTIQPRISAIEPCSRWSRARSTAHEFGDDFFGHRRGFQLVGLVGMASDQHAGLERLDRQRLDLEHLMGDLEAGALETLDPAFDRDPVAMGGRDVEFRARVDHGNADQPIFLDDVLLGEAGRLEHDRGGIVEHREIARVIDDVGGVAIAPLDLGIAPVHEHAVRPISAPCAAMRRAAPL